MQERSHNVYSYKRKCQILLNAFLDLNKVIKIRMVTKITNWAKELSNCKNTHVVFEKVVFCWSSPLTRCRSEFQDGKNVAHGPAPKEGNIKNVRYTLYMPLHHHLDPPLTLYSASYSFNLVFVCLPFSYISVGDLLFFLVPHIYSICYLFFVVFVMFFWEIWLVSLSFSGNLLSLKK